LVGERGSGVEEGVGEGEGGGGVGLQKVLESVVDMVYSTLSLI
jgi:hypothetical protein